MSEIIPENILETATELARKPFVVFETENAKLVALPEDSGWSLIEQDSLEKFNPTPKRKVGITSHSTVESFIDYINRHKTANSTVWTDIDLKKQTVQFTSVFDDHNSNDTGWRQHRTLYTPVTSVEWETWSKNDGQKMTQEEMAKFIDDNIKDIATVAGRPTGTEMLQMATNFEITSDKRMKSAVRLQSGGISVEYVDNEDTATASRMQVFDRFVIGISPFYGGQAYQIEARLRYKIREGNLAIWYELVRPDIVIDTATSAMIEQIKAATELPLFKGKP